MPRDNDVPKLCLSCARHKLSGKPSRNCGTCILLNMDPMAKIRANSAKPSPLANFSFLTPSVVISDPHPSQKPARATRGGYGAS